MFADLPWPSPTPTVLRGRARVEQGRPKAGREDGKPESRGEVRGDVVTVVQLELPKSHEGLQWFSPFAAQTGEAQRPLPELSE